MRKGIRVGIIIGIGLMGLPALNGSSVIPTAHAKKKKSDEGIPVKVVVVDEEGNPISTAVVRHPQEADRNRVNTFDGSWTASVLYLPDGSEIKFEKGVTLELEVSAPGYVNQKIMYTIRKRKNVITVTLAKMDLSLEEDEDLEDPVIQFGRDRPIDGATNNDPAN